MLLFGWGSIPVEVQESNRTAADALAASLRGVGCELVPLGGWGAPQVELADSEIEQLAAHEHERWMAERLAAGWRYGETRDAAARVNPLLRPWAEIDEAARADGREAARRIPGILARAGLEVLRVGSVPGSDGGIIKRV